MSPEERKEWQSVLSNWGRWAGGGLDEPALVNYYTVSPMFRDAPFTRNREPSPPAIDVELAELAERAILELMKADKAAFRLLRARYAYNRTQQHLADSWKTSRQSLQRMLDHAEEMFADAYRDGHKKGRLTL